MDTPMNITSAKYVDSDNYAINIVIDGRTFSVPPYVDNTHYAEILRQVADGTITIEDAD